LKISGNCIHLFTDLIFLLMKNWFNNIRFILILLFSFGIFNGYSQTVASLEENLRYYKSEDGWGTKKDKAIKLLSLDKLNQVAIQYIIQIYDKANQKDSIKIFYENLIKENKESVIPYLLRVELSQYESLNNLEKIKYLTKAYAIDSSNVQVTYLLAKQYYELFNKEIIRNKNKKNLDIYARQATVYLNHLCNINTRYEEPSKFPLIQLSNYLGDKKGVSKYKKYNVQSLYFPIIAFANLSKNWETDYSFNVIDCTESASLDINWFSIKLNSLDEPILSDSLPNNIFRFFYLRSFIHPLVIRLENIKDSTILYWKECDGNGSYSPCNLITSKKKVLSLKEWSAINTKINSIKFWDLPTKKENLFGSDGAQWVLEGKVSGRYHVVDRWSGGEIATVCEELLKLTDFNLKKNEIY